MKKITIISVCLIIAMMLGAITVNAVTATTNLQLLYSDDYSYPPQHRYLEGLIAFTLTSSDMGSQTRRTIQHKIFAHDAAYYNMTHVTDYSDSSTNYGTWLLAPLSDSNPYGGNYGGDPCWVYIQQADFPQGIRIMSATVRVNTIMMAIIGDTWCKDEAYCFVAGGGKTFVTSKLITDSQPSPKY